VPSWADLEKTTAEREELYTREDPPGDPIPVVVTPFDIEDAPPTDEEIATAVRRKKSGKAAGISGLRAEDFKAWLAAAEREEGDSAYEPKMWNCLCKTIRHIHSSGETPQELVWSICILLPKPDGGIRGIGLLEPLWKLMATVMDSRFKSAITFHDAIHGFVRKRGCTTAIFEASMTQQLSMVNQEPLYQIFLDLKKAYDCVDRERVLDILEKYGVGPNTLRLIRTFWERQEVVARQAGYYGRRFKPTRGCTQGDVLSPTIFNIVCDAIIRYWLTVVGPGTDTATAGLGTYVQDNQAFFYADDGLIGSTDPEWLQEAFNFLTELFERVGLKTNTNKTKAMICHPGSIATQQSTAGYRHRTLYEGGNFRERQRERVVCPHCPPGSGRTFTKGSINQHIRTQHGVAPPRSATEEAAAPQSYRISFPQEDMVGPMECPVDGCCGSSKTRYLLRRHFMYRHPQHSLTIVEEGGKMWVVWDARVVRDN